MRPKYTDRLKVAFKWDFRLRVFKRMFLMQINFLEDVGNVISGLYHLISLLLLPLRVVLFPIIFVIKTLNAARRMTNKEYEKATKLINNEPV